MPEVHYFYDLGLSFRANCLLRNQGVTSEEQAVRELPEILRGKYDNIGKKTIKELRAWLDAHQPHPLRLTFTIDHPGESAAGLSSFTDTVTVEVESGNPGGEEGEFAEYMAQCLREWYDGTKVDRREG